MTKPFFLVIVTCLFFVGCVTSNKAIQTTAASKEVPQEDNSSPGAHAPGIVISSQVDSAALKQQLYKMYVQQKYAGILRVPAEKINLRLYGFIDEWLDTPYKWGGSNKSGIDCSAFLQVLFNEVYGLKLPRTSITQVLTQRVEKYKSPKYLAEGDILFFRTAKDKLVSHVGFYLANYKFVNASSHKGVVICSLLDDYWKNRFVVAARVRTELAQNSLTNTTMR